MSMHPIKFKGAHSVLSNFYPHWLHAEELGFWFYSVEQGYQHQCAIFNGYDDVAYTLQTVTPCPDTGVICKELAKQRIKFKRESWRDVKEDILYDFLQLKLEQCQPFRETLLATERPLHHTVASGYWGLGKDKTGLNRLGKLLMKLRQEVKATWPTPRRKVLLYSDSIFKFLPPQLEEVGFQVLALPGASIGGRKKIGDYIQRQKIQR